MANLMNHPSHSSASFAAQAIVAMKGRFEFSQHRDFKRSCQAPLADDAIHTIVIDLKDVTYMDSSALGMLLLLREQAKAVGKNVELRGANGVVADVLKVANFDKLFAASAKP
jgi:anti-anti-sigma factor